MRFPGCRIEEVHPLTTSTNAITVQHDMHPSLLVSVKNTFIIAEPTRSDICVHKNRLLLFYPISDAEAFMVEFWEAKLMSTHFIEVGIPF